MSKKKIEPTDAMVDEVANALSLEATGTSLRFHAGAAQHTYRHRARVALHVVLNHLDTAELLAAPGADRPWEPLDGPVYVGDEVRQDHYGITHTAVVGRVDVEGDPWTAKNGFIGVLDEGTWYVRRAVQELPTEDGAVIVPADGSEFIEQVGDCANYRRLTYDAASGRWIGWDMLNHEAEALSPEGITPGTWQVADE